MSPNNCSLPQETVHLYLDGVLNPTQRQAFITHLQRCSTCQMRLTELQTLFAELDSWIEISPPLEISERVMHNLPQLNRLPPQTIVGQGILLSQIVSGSLLLLLLWPIMVSNLNWPATLSLGALIVELALAFNTWFMNTIAPLTTQWQSQWPPTLTMSPVNISSLTITALVIALSLAWLIGNILLLRQTSPILKSGGRS